jgi:hypothetical protein
VKLTRHQIKRIVDQEINKSLNESMNRRQFCKVAAGTAAFFSAGCQEYEFSHVADDNTENMQLPECVQNCYYNDYDNPESWPKEIEQFTQQFEGEKFVDVTITGDLSKFGQNDYQGIPALVVAFHNVPAESPSLEEVLHMDDSYANSYWSDDKVLMTVELYFLIKDNMIYFNDRQPGGPHDPERQHDNYGEGMPNFSIQGDAYVRGRRSSQLKQCRDAYEAYLFGPIRKDKQEAP